MAHRAQPAHRGLGAWCDVYAYTSHQAPMYGRTGGRSCLHEGLEPAAAGHHVRGFGGDVLGVRVLGVPKRVQLGAGLWHAGERRQRDGSVHPGQLGQWQCGSDVSFLNDNLPLTAV